MCTQVYDQQASLYGTKAVAEWTKQINIQFDLSLHMRWIGHPIILLRKSLQGMRRACQFSKLSLHS